MSKELLAVLEISEDEQYEWYCENWSKYNMPYLRYFRVKRYRKMAFADLAFRLRDEAVDFNLYLEALEIVYHLWQKRGSVEEQMENNLITFTCWLAVYITAIDRIIAALIAKNK